MDDKNLPTPQSILAFGLTNIGCDQRGAVFQTVVQTPTPENEEVVEEDKTSPLTWQQILTDYAVPDDKCKESYGWHNVRIAMYIKALEEVHLLHVCDRQGTNAVSFYQTLTEIFHFPIIQSSIETQINHLHENERNKHIYRTEILPLIKSLIEAA